MTFVDKLSLTPNYVLKTHDQKNRIIKNFKYFLKKKMFYFISVNITFINHSCTLSSIREKKK